MADGRWAMAAQEPYLEKVIRVIGLSRDKIKSEMRSIVMKKNDPRKAYWNEQYRDYWRSRVNEAGDGKSKIIDGDSNTEGDDVYEAVFSRFEFNQGSLLEVGCAWGRMFPLYLGRGLQVSGVDISQAMIEEARKDWAGKDGIIDIQESPAEELPFPDGTFDNLSCLAVLDATFQNQAVTEFLRVTKSGARIYITGKNDLYYSDDNEAYAAEVGARNKNHPNFFTDTHKLVQLLEEQGHKIEQGYYFPRRGDFAAFNFLEMEPARYYEYLLVITRGDSYSALPEFSDAYSKTFSEINS